MVAVDILTSVYLGTCQWTVKGDSDCSLSVGRVLASYCTPAKGPKDVFPATLSMCISSFVSTPLSMGGPEFSNSVRVGVLRELMGQGGGWELCRDVSEWASAFADAYISAVVETGVDRRGGEGEVYEAAVDGIVEIHNTHSVAGPVRCRAFRVLAGAAMGGRGGRPGGATRDGRGIAFDGMEACFVGIFTSVQQHHKELSGYVRIVKEGVETAAEGGGGDWGLGREVAGRGAEILGRLGGGEGINLGRVVWRGEKGGLDVR